VATEEEKLAALRKQMAQLEAQAASTQESLTEALTIPGTKKLAEEIAAVTEAIKDQLNTRGQLKAEIESLRVEEQRLKDAQAEGAEVTEQLQGVVDRLTEANISLNKVNQTFAQTLSQNSEIASEFADVIDDINNGLAVNKDRLAAAQVALQDLNDATQAGNDLAEGLKDQFFGLSGNTEALVQAFSGGSAGLKGFASNLMDTTDMANMAGSGILKLAKASFDFALEQDRVFSEFRKATGAGTEFNNMIKETEQAGRIAGVTLAESAEAVTAFKNNFTDFTYLQPQVQKDILRTTTLLGEMGFSMDTQSQIFQTANKSLGLSVKESQQFLLDMAGAARSLGKDINAMGADFEANREILARYGKDATQAFLDMEKQAKATGIEVGTLLGFVDQFKTFDQAGQAVGRLNAIMGGPFLNSIDMLNASMEDPVEGIKMMKSALDQAGVSAENLSGAEVMAFADALGLSAEDTRKMLSQSNEELELQQMTMKEAAEEAQNMQNITDKLTNAFKQLYLDAEPFITNVLVPMVDGFAKLMGFLGEAINSMGTFASTAVFAGLAMAGFMMATGVGTPFAIAAMAILGGLGVGAMTSMGEKGEGGGRSAVSSPGTLKGYSGGGRHISATPNSPTSVGVAGENGAELVEFGTAANISTASTTERLTKALEDVSMKLGSLETGGGENINLAVSIAGEKIDELVIKSLKSQRTRTALGPFR
tara:strand:- start:20697 stop:22823 length:2127 start_codon:yes stop_codon:yes gene_type:complete